MADVLNRVVSYGGDFNEQIAALLRDVLDDTKSRRLSCERRAVRSKRWQAPH